MLGYDSTISYSTGVPPESELRTGVSDDGLKLLTKEDIFNFSIPTSLTGVDKNNDGYADTLYFGNVGGHLFKTDISNPDPLKWKTYIMFKTEIVDKGSSTISAIDDALSVITLAAKATQEGFELGDSVMGKTSYATGYIREFNLRDITVTVTSGTFQVDEEIVSRTYNPIYLPPALTYDSCFALWVNFGTGDRDRPRTNQTNGHFVMFKDNKNYLHQLDNDVTTLDETNLLKDISAMWTDDTLPQTSLTDVNGWYFKFPDDGEKIFDPEIIILPDKYFNPRILFNTYQPPAIVTKSVDNPCDAPDEGTMTFYELIIGCGLSDTIAGDTHKGRIAGGGMYGGKEFILYEGTDGNVASAPASDEEGFESHVNLLDYTGGIVFLKVKNR
jgi:hypothetical protein